MARASKGDLRSLPVKDWTQSAVFQVSPAFLAFLVQAG